MESMKQGQNNNQPAHTVKHATDRKSDNDITIIYTTTQDNYVAIDAVIVDRYHWI